MEKTSKRPKPIKVLALHLIDLARHLFHLNTHAFDLGFHSCNDISSYLFDSSEADRTPSVIQFENFFGTLEAANLVADLRVDEASVSGPNVATETKRRGCAVTVEKLPTLLFQKVLYQHSLGKLTGPGRIIIRYYGSVHVIH